MSYGLQGTTIIEIGGTTPGSSGHDQLNHSGTATLAGTLEVQLFNGFTPSAGDAFEVMTSVDGSGNTLATITFSGGFTRHGGALLDGYYQLTIEGSKVRRKDTQLTLDGDSDGSQGGDFSRGELETDAFFALYGDTNGDGFVGIAELGQFRASFGKTPTQAGYNELWRSWSV